MKVTINGKPEDIESGMAVEQLLALKDLPTQQVVIEINGELVKRDRWAEVTLQAEDTVEILRFVGGG